jgi:P2 family phage major capsid protein
MGRTDTSGNGERATADPTNNSTHGYVCVPCEFDTHLTWAKIDAWAAHPEFQRLISSYLAKAYGADLIRVGFNGTHAAGTTNKTNFPMLQDVAKGWLQHIREDAPERRFFEDAPASAHIYHGTHASNEYKNIDAIVTDAVNSFLPDWARSAPLVAMVGYQMLDDKYFNLINDNDKPTEVNAAQIIMANKKLGGLPAYQVPFMPAGTILITTFDNLSIYEQSGKRRRHIKDAPESDRIEDYQSANQAFVIEDLDYACMIENIVQKDAA